MVPHLARVVERLVVDLAGARVAEGALGELAGAHNFAARAECESRWVCVCASVRAAAPPIVSAPAEQFLGSASAAEPRSLPKYRLYCKVATSTPQLETSTPRPAAGTDNIVCVQ